MIRKHIYGFHRKWFFIPDKKYLIRNILNNDRTGRSLSHKQGARARIVSSLADMHSASYLAYRWLCEPLPASEDHNHL